MSKPSKRNQSSLSPATWKIVSIHDYLLLLKERWVTALALALIASIAFGYYQYTRPKVYKATSQLQVNQRMDRVVDMKEVVDQTVRTYGFLESSIQQIKSKAFAEFVAQNLTQEERQTILSSQTNPSNQNEIPQTAAVIRGTIKPHNKPQSPTISISAESNNPKIAQLISSKVAEKYTTYILERNSVSNSSAVEFLQDQVETLRIKIEAGDRALQAYRKDNNLVSLEENQNIIVERLKTLNGALGEIKLERLGIETKVEQVQLVQQKGTDMMSLSSISSYGSIQELIIERDLLQSSRLTLNERYFDKHPKMLENASQTQAIQQQLKQNIELAIKDLNNQVKEVVETQNRIETALESAEQNSFELDRLGVEYDVIRRKLENEKRTFDQLFSRLNEARITSQLNNTNIQVLDLASRAGLIHPIPKTIALRTGMLFLILLGGIPLVLEFLRNKASNRWDIEEFLGQNYLCGFPHIKEAPSPKLIFNGENEVVAETFRALFSEISLGSDFDALKTILFTSTLPSEGKSSITSNIAACAAAHGRKTLILDCDFRRPSQHKIFDVSNEGGSLNWLTTKDELCTSKLNIQSIGENLFLLAPGGTTQKPTEIIQGTRFKQMLEKLKDEYDFIAIDASPIGLFSESLFLAQQTDSTIYICQHNKINRHKLKHFLSTLEEHKADVLGIVFNQMKSTGQSNHSYGYGNYKEQQKYYKAYNQN